MADLDLQAIEQIKRVKYLYCRAIDTADMKLLESVLTEDVAFDYWGGTYRWQVEGRQAFLEAIKHTMNEHFVSCHTVTHPIIDIAPDGQSATGAWRLLDYSLDTADNNLTTFGASDYADEYVLDAGQWKISKSSYRRLYERCLNEPDPHLVCSMLGGTSPGWGTPS